MARRHFVIAAALALFALPLAAQNGVAGKWNANIDTPNGPILLVFELIIDAAGKLTGTLQNEFLGSIPIKDGTVNGNDVSFKLSIEGGPNGAMNIGYKGTVKGDERAMTSKFEGEVPGGGPAEQQFKATRAK